MNHIAEEILMHYGIKRRSGRYPWGSGENPYQHSGDWLSRVETLTKEGKSQKEIAEYMEMSTGDLVAWKAIAKDERTLYRIATTKTMLEDGHSQTEIAQRLGVNESVVRDLVKKSEHYETKASISRNVADSIARQIETRGAALDVGKGAELNFEDPVTGKRLSREKFEQALNILDAEGYRVYGIGEKQVTVKDQQTNVMYACPKGTNWGDLYKKEYKNPDTGEWTTEKLENASDVRPLVKKESLVKYEVDLSNMPKETVFQYPASLSSKRIKVEYAEDGGSQKDGVIYLRRGVEDISLGEKNYAQVRILVDDTHYLKGMAMYKDDMPDGVDVIFNTSKHKGTPMMGEKDNTVLKPIERKKDGTPMENPFGSEIKRNGQRWYTDKDGNEHLSLINRVNEEGDWDDWSKTLSSQFLSKQPRELVHKQLNLAVAQRQEQFDEIKNYTNPTVKRMLLQEFADSCDRDAVDLKAASLPRQSTKVILPVDTLKDNEIYAPTYNNGDKVVLIRHPHQGIFEIPTLTVNNRHPDGKKLLGDSQDAVGINSTVASRLSGADFDGDSVIVIPVNDRVRIRTQDPSKDPYLKDLVGFDPREAYPARDGMRKMTKQNKQTEMGKVSNLITDMTLQGAPPEDIAKAVKHAQVVIDAEKHNLDYKKSEADNNIKELKEKWMKHTNEAGNESVGASTIVSRASSEKTVTKTKGNPNVNPYTGEQSWEEMRYFDPKKGKEVVKPSKRVEEYYTKTEYWNAETHKWQTKKIEGAKVRTTEVMRTKQSTQMAETNDAMTLVSPMRHPIEIEYANYANTMKQMANDARKEIYSTGKLQYNREAAEIYSAEVKSLESKLYLANLNKPKEREANRLAESIVQKQKQDNPDISKDKMGKLRNRAMVEARLRVGADGKSSKIYFTDKEWEAIQAGAIHDTKLKQLLDASDKDRVKELALPKQSKGLTPSQISTMKAMQASGYTQKEIADRLGVSVSTVSKNLR